MPLEPVIYSLIALATANAFLIVWVFRLVRSQSGSANGLAVNWGGRFDGIDRNTEALRRVLTEMDQALRGEIATGTRDGLTAAFDKVQEGTKVQAEQLGAFGKELGTRLDGLKEGVRTGFSDFSQQLRDQQEQLRDKVDKKLEEIRTGNEAKLEEMRKAVDEQLQSALEKRLDESFKRVTEQFAHIQQAIGQVKDVTGQIGDLRRLFSNVKARGGWGEAHLQALLDDVLPPGSYETNVRVNDDTGEVVEFALRMPHRDRWLAMPNSRPRIMNVCWSRRRQAIAIRNRPHGKRLSGGFAMKPSAYRASTSRSGRWNLPSCICPARGYTARSIRYRVCWRRCVGSMM
jgi:hypothetical protein